MFFRWICSGESGLPVLFLRHLSFSPLKNTLSLKKSIKKLTRWKSYWERFSTEWFVQSPTLYSTEWFQRIHLASAYSFKTVYPKISHLFSKVAFTVQIKSLELVHISVVKYLKTRSGNASLPLLKETYICSQRTSVSENKTTVSGHSIGWGQIHSTKLPGTRFGNGGLKYMSRGYYVSEEIE